MQANDHAWVKVLSLLVTGLKRCIQAVSTAPTIAQDAPSFERKRLRKRLELQQLQATDGVRWSLPLPQVVRGRGIG